MDRIAGSMGLRYFVVGATARNILMYHLHGVLLLAACDYAFERAGPRLLGRDITSIVSAQCKSQIVAILTTRAVRDQLGQG